MPSRIAIVDDEKIVLSLIQDALEGPELEIHTFDQPQLAVAGIPALNVELILSDIRMPGLSGTELMAALREQGVTAPFIFMTGYASLDSAKDAIRLGASGYINKPFELEELRQSIAGVLKANADQQKSDNESRLQTLGRLLFDSSDQQAVIESTLRFSRDHSRADLGTLVIIKKQQGLTMSLSAENPAITTAPLPAEVARALVQRLGGSETQPSQISDALRTELLSSLSRTDELPADIGAQFSEKYSLLSVPVSVEQASFGVILLGFADDSVRLRRADLALLALTGRQLAITLYNQELLEESKEAFSRLNDAQDQMIGLERLAERGETSAEVGHELNNFLQVVRGNVELINLWLRKGSYDQMPVAMAKITDAVVSMTRFTAELMGDNDQPETRTERSLTELVQQVLERVTVQKRFRGIRVSASLPSGSPLAVSLDSTRIQQLLYNLMNNAADAMKQADKRELTVVLREDQAGHSANLEIQDTGCGFAPEDLQRAFSERFTTKKNGHGFGLLVCKKIIESHDGTLEVRSEAGKGTTISIQFPLVAAAMTA